MRTTPCSDPLRLFLFFFFVTFPSPATSMVLPTSDSAANEKHAFNSDARSKTLSGTMPTCAAFSMSNWITVVSVSSRTPSVTDDDDAWWSELSRFGARQTARLLASIRFRSLAAATRIRNDRRYRSVDRLVSGSRRHASSTASRHDDVTSAVPTPMHWINTS